MALGGMFKTHNAIIILPKAILICSSLIPRSTSPMVLDLGGKSRDAINQSPKFQDFVCLLDHIILFIGNLPY